MRFWHIKRVWRVKNPFITKCCNWSALQSHTSSYSNTTILSVFHSFVQVIVSSSDLFSFNCKTVADEQITTLLSNNLKTCRQCVSLKNLYEIVANVNRRSHNIPLAVFKLYWRIQKTTEEGNEHASDLYKCEFKRWIIISATANSTKTLTRCPILLGVLFMNVWTMFHFECRSPPL